MGRTSDARQRLRESASELIHERGYNAVGVGEICARAGVHKGSFYYFYDSKQKLALDVIDTAWHDARTLIEATLLGDGPPLRRLRSYLERVYAFHQGACDEAGGELRGCPLGNLALEMSTSDSLMRARLSQTFEGHVGYFENLLGDARERGDLASDLDVRQSAEALVALLEGKILLAKVRSDPGTLKDLPTLVGRLLAADL